MVDVDHWVTYFVQCFHDGYWITMRSSNDIDIARKFRDEYDTPDELARIVKAECEVMKRDGEDAVGSGGDTDG